MAFFQKIIFVFALLVVSPCFANDMINNRSIGVVNGSITQIAEQGSINEVNVGSIIGGKAKNVSVQAYVNGDIIVSTDRGRSVILDIGSYRSKK